MRKVLLVIILYFLNFQAAQNGSHYNLKTTPDPVKIHVFSEFLFISQRENDNFVGK